MTGYNVFITLLTPYNKGNNVLTIPQQKQNGDYFANSTLSMLQQFIPSEIVTGFYTVFKFKISQWIEKTVLECQIHPRFVDPFIDRTPFVVFII